MPEKQRLVVKTRQLLPRRPHFCHNLERVTGTDYIHMLTTRVVLHCVVEGLCALAQPQQHKATMVLHTTSELDLLPLLLVILNWHTP